MNFESYYRKLTDKERNGKPYKYELIGNYVQRGIDLGDKDLFIRGWVYYRASDKSLWITKGYRWDGSTVVLDTKPCMRASAVHDALQQLINTGKLDRKKYQNYADRLYRDICIEDGMWKIRAYWRYTGLCIKATLDRLFAASAAKGEK